MINDLAAPRILTLLSFRIGLSREESAVVAKEKRYYVYIVASKSRILYVGMTGFLMARVLQHKSGEAADFTDRYSINRLVYYESFRSGGAKRKLLSSRRAIRRGRTWPPIGVNRRC